MEPIMLTFEIHHNLMPDFKAIKTYSSGITVLELKEKLSLLTGSKPGSMALKCLMNGSEIPLNNDSLALQDCALSSSSTIILMVIDNDPFSILRQIGEGSSTYELDEEKYAQRDDTFRAFLAQGKIKRQHQVKASVQDDVISDEYVVGARCAVTTQGMERRGSIAYVGKPGFAPGIWVGVILDEPTGKNDGTVKGKRYFTCLQNYGLFVKPENVKVGAYPELDIDEL